MTNSSGGRGGPDAAAVESARAELARLLGPAEVLGDPLALRL
jgi:hypothetical protein